MSAQSTGAHAGPLEHRVGHHTARLIKAPTVHVLDWNALQVDPVETPDIDGPTMECLHTLLRFVGCPSPRPAEGQDAARRAEVVLCGEGVPLIEREHVQWRQDAQSVFRYAVNQRAPASTDRTVANAHVIEIKIYLEPRASTVTGTGVGLDHGA